MNNIIIKYTNHLPEEFDNLSDELNAELQQMFGQKQDKYKKYNLLNDITDFFVCYKNEIAIGCGAIKKYEENIYEIKRVYVKSEYRGNGISKIIMEEIEKKAKSKGVKRLILETGEGLVAAMNLYKNIGYKKIDNYGQYKNMNESVCLGKYI